MNKSDDELAKKFFEIQKQFPVKEDWILEVYKNLEFCEINLSEREIKKMSKYRFKKLVKKQIKLRAEEYLASLREDHSKSKKLQIYKLQSYLKNENMTRKEKQLLFQLRTRSTPTRANYKSKYKFDLTCPLCNDITSEQTDAHLLDCTYIVNMLPAKIQLDKVNYDMIFKNSQD